MGNCIISPPSKVKVISGPSGSRMVIGKASWRCLGIERVETLDLEMLTLEVISSDAETVRGVKLSTKSICQVKVDAYLDAGPEGQGQGSNGRRQLNENALSLACQHFLGKQKDTIKTCLRSTLEGHQRQILGTLTVEELYKDRAAFADRVREHVFNDIKAMGFVLVSYTVTSIGDKGGYMDDLGVTQTSLVRREAAEGRSRNEAEARKQTSQYDAESAIVAAENDAESHVQAMLQKQREVDANRDLDLRTAANLADVNRANAEAKVAGEIAMAQQDQKLVMEKTKQEAIRAEGLLEYQKQEALRQQTEMEGSSKASLLQDENLAQGVRVKAEAEADRVRLVGTAEAEVLVKKGEAEAKVLQMRADAFQSFGQAAMMSEIVEKLPALAEAIAAPLAKTEKMVFVSSDGATGSKLTADMSTMLAQLGPTVEGLTGFNLAEALKKLAGQDGSAASGAVRAR